MTTVCENETTEETELAALTLEENVANRTEMVETEELLDWIFDDEDSDINVQVDSDSEGEM